jgi:hypothetical protein
VCYWNVVDILRPGKGNALRNPRDIQREVIQDLGNHIRVNRRGLPLVECLPDKKETKTQKIAREKREDHLGRIAEDHVSMYQKSISRDDTDLKFNEDDDEEGNDDLDAEEAENIQKGLLDMIADELDDDEEASSSSSESGDEQDPNETNIALLDKNSQSIRTEQVNRKFS